MTNTNPSLSVNSVNRGETPNNLLNSESIVQMFCMNPENIDEQNESGLTPLHRTISDGNSMATGHFLQLGANPNIKCNVGKTALFQAVEMGSISQVQILLSHGADPNIPDNDGKIPLHVGVLRENLAIVEMLLQKGSNANYRNTYSGSTPVHLAVQHSVKVSILLLLVEHGGSLIIKDKNGKKPIEYAETDEMKAAIKMLRLEMENAFTTPQKKYPNSFSALSIDNVILAKYSNTESNIKRHQDKEDLNLVSKNVNPGETCPLTYRENNKKRLDSYAKNKEEVSMGSTPVTKNGAISDINPLEYIFSKSTSKRQILNEDFSQVLNDPNENEIIIENAGENPNEFGDEQFKNTTEHNQVDNHSYLKNEGESDDSLEDNELSYSHSKASYLISDIPPTSVKKHKISSITIGAIEANNNNQNDSFREEKHEIISKKLNFNKMPYSSASNDSKENNINIINTIQLPQPNSPRQSTVIRNSHSLIRPKLSPINPQSCSSKQNSFITQSNRNFNGLEQDFASRNQSNTNTAIHFNYFTNYTSHSNSRSELTEHGLNNNQYRSRKDFHSNVNEHSNLGSNGKMKKISILSELYDRKMSPSTILSKQSCIRSPGCGEPLFNNSESYLSNISTKNAAKLHDWLESIGLQCYYCLFLEKGIFYLDQFIEGMKNETTRLSYEDIEEIGIRMPGHIYRILIKLEIDSKIIPENVVNFIMRSVKKCETKTSINLKISTEKDIFCGFSYNKRRTDDLLWKDLISWLKVAKLPSLRQNFVHNGFDLIEYFVLQMFSSFPITDSLIEDCLHIYNAKDRKGILSQLKIDVKIINSQLRSFFSSDSMMKFENESSEESCQICLIF